MCGWVVCHSRDQKVGTNRDHSLFVFRLSQEWSLIHDIQFSGEQESEVDKIIICVCVCVFCVELWNHKLHLNEDVC